MSSFPVIFIVVWAMAVGVWWGVSNFLKSADADKVKTRLLGSAKKRKEKSAKDAPMSLIKQEDKVTGKVAMKLLRRFELTERLGQLLEQSGLKWNPARFMHSCMAMFLLVFWIAWTMLPPTFRLLAILPAAFASCLPLVFVLRKRSARLHKFEEQFPEGLEFVARSMRAGHAFSVSLEMIHREFTEPLAGEFRRAFEEHNLGLPLDTALESLSKRVPSLDVHFFVSAVLLQKRTGGNLAEILDKLAYLIRERFKLRGKIRAISAHGRMTGMALSSIPIAVGVIMYYVNPEHMTFFFTEEVGMYMAGAAIALQIAGYLVIRKIVSIEV